MNQRFCDRQYQRRNLCIYRWIKGGNRNRRSLLLLHTHKEGSFEVNDYNSVFHAEIVGTTKGTKWASALTRNSINLLVDCQAAILGENNRLSVRNSVNILWDPLRIEGNKKADQSTHSRAVRNAILLNFPRPFSSLNSCSQQWATEEHLKAWNTSKSGYTTKVLLGKCWWRI